MNPRYIKHGLTKHRFYKSWGRIMDRCYNEKHSMYRYYGGRGITVSDEFKDVATFIKFLEGLDGYGINDRTTIDRIENDGNYERGNIRWANKQEQQYNKRVECDSTSGITGVSFNKQAGKWRAYIYANDKMIHIGFSDTPTGAKQLRVNYIKSHKIPCKQ